MIKGYALSHSHSAWLAFGDVLHLLTSVRPSEDRDRRRSEQLAWNMGDLCWAVQTDVHEYAGRLDSLTRIGHPELIHMVCT